jgi:16S rRNA (guanine966-N2)-methyltransferase
VTRIIGGSVGGRGIRTPPGVHTRPTADRVREALFSAIESALGSITGLAFLDLYAGSGAVGLEALSRGAGAATLVERDRRAARLIGQNARQLGLSADVRATTVRQVLATAPRAAYDVAFLDPPYATTTEEVEGDLTRLCAGGWLAEGAIVVVERATRSRPIRWPPGCAGERSRRYGETMLWYGHAAGPPTG